MNCRADKVECQSSSLVEPQEEHIGAFDEDGAEMKSGSRSIEHRSEHIQC